MEEENTRRWRIVSGTSQTYARRVAFLRMIFVLLAAVIILRLFLLQVLDHDVYQALASGQHELFEQLFPTRGSILAQDLKDKTTITVATNEQAGFLYAEPRNVKDPEGAARKIGTLLGYDEEKIMGLWKRLSDKQDPYDPIEHRVPNDTIGKIKKMDLAGIRTSLETVRLYPERTLGGHVLGFLGYDETGRQTGKYGIEGYFERELAGKMGFLKSERDISGRIIALGDRSFEPAVDGSDVVLTIDRTIQHVACTALRKAVQAYQADGGSVIILDPSTGKVLAMCGAPDFDPNRYRETQDLDIFNNPAIFKAYEPGSIFKPITIAAALDSGAVSPSTTFEDTGSLQIDKFTIKNSDGTANGLQTMTQVLEKSLNTGVIFAMRKTGRSTFVDYVKRFGFGQAAGMELETEVAGNISSLKSNGEIFAATASFGQGITVTPLQMAAAFAAIANGGILKQPYIVEEIRHPDGTVDRREPNDVRRVMETKSARLLSAMLVAVVENGHGKRAGVDGYYIAGKTGTAQVAKKDGVGYEEGKNIGSFGGFGPAGSPRFAMVVRIDNPHDVSWAETTAAPLFGEIAAFLLQYFEIPPTR